MDSQSIPILKRPRSCRDWRTLVRRWKESGMTEEEYSKNRGLNYERFQHWKAVFEEANQKESRGHERRQNFQEVFLPQVLPCFPQLYEYEFGSGQVLRIPENFRTETLKSLLQVLGAR